MTIIDFYGMFRLARMSDGYSRHRRERKVRTLFMPQGISKVIAANSGGKQRRISPLAREIIRQVHGKFCRKTKYLEGSNAFKIATETYRSPPAREKQG